MGVSPSCIFLMVFILWETVASFCLPHRLHLGLAGQGHSLSALHSVVALIEDQTPLLSVVPAYFIPSFSSIPVGVAKGRRVRGDQLQRTHCRRNIRTAPSHYTLYGVSPYTPPLNLSVTLFPDASLAFFQSVLFSGDLFPTAVLMH